MTFLANTQVRDLTSAIVAAIEEIFETASTKFTPTTGPHCGEEVDLDPLNNGTLVSASGSEYFRVARGYWVRYDGQYFSSAQVAEKLLEADLRKIIYLG
jgi:hypothetical protein